MLRLGFSKRYNIIDSMLIIKLHVSQHPLGIFFFIIIKGIYVVRKFAEFVRLIN